VFGLDNLFAPAMLAALVAIIIVGAIKHGTIGFGFPLVSTPLIALLIDVKTAVFVTVIPNIAVNVVSILRGGNWRESIGRHWPLAIWVALGTIVGTRVLLVAPPELLQVVLAAMIVVFLAQAKGRSPISCARKKSPRVTEGAEAVSSRRKKKIQEERTMHVDPASNMPTAVVDSKPLISAHPTLRI
jgi:hypothetical protein